MLAKARQFVPLNELKNVYHAIFPSHLMVAKFGHKSFSQLLTKCQFYKKNAVRIMTFSDFNAHSEPLFKQLDILKFNDNIVLQNYLFVYDYLKGNLPSSFEFTFNRVDESHSIKTRMAETGMLSIPRFNSTTYVLKSIYKNCINSWNMLTFQLNLLEKDKAKNNYIEIDLLKMHSKNKLKSVIADYFLSSYKFSI